MICMAPCLVLAAFLSHAETTTTNNKHAKTAKTAEIKHALGVCLFIGKLPRAILGNSELFEFSCMPSSQCTNTNHIGS